MFTHSKEGFLAVVADLKPSLVIVFSFRVWDTIKSLLTNSGTCPNSVGETAYFGTFERLGTPIVILGLPHPRSPAFRNARHWHSTIGHFLEQCRPIQS